MKTNTRTSAMRPRDWMKTCRSLGFLIPFLLGPLICLVSAARAQELPSPSKTPGVEAQAPNAEQQPQASPPAESKAEEKAEKKEEREKKEEKILHGGSIVIAPIPLVSPALGSGIVPVAGYIFPFEENKKRPEPSVIGAAGLITNNGTRAWVLGSDIYLKDARYELKAAYARGNLDYNLYGPGFVNGNAGLKLPLEQSGSFFFAEFMRRLVWDIYVGGRFINGSSLITLKPNDGNIPPIPPDIGLQTNLRALGFEVERDTRPNRFYPLRGSFIQFTGDFFGKDLGSKYSFQSYKFTFNKYASLGHQQVLAYNLYFCGTGGEAPFYGKCTYGTNNELRGYTAGRYLDEYMFATQLEYRLELRWCLGVVAFGGFGGVAPGASKFRTDQFLPAGGTGIRFLLSKKYHVNLRTDFAWGKDNFTWSMGVGEAF